MLSFPTIAAVTVGGPNGTVVHYPAQELLPAVAAAGFRGVGLDWFTLRDAETRGTTMVELAAFAADLGLTWTDLSALGLTDDATKGVGVARSMARRCEALGIPVCGLVISSAPTDAMYEQVADCADLFVAAGARLALEFMPSSGVHTLRQAREICAQVGSDRCAVMIDSLHLARSGGSAADIAELTAVEVAFVQLADAGAETPADLVHESRNDRRLPGAGELDLSAFTAALKGIGYTGTVSVEVLAADLRTLAPGPMARAYFDAASAYVDGT